MAPARGLEPPAHSLGNCCSILMSYAGVCKTYTFKIGDFQDLNVCKHKKTALLLSKTVSC